MNQINRVLISAGDHSADLHGESLIKALKLQNPNLQSTALGGKRLKNAADHFIRDMVEMDISGISQPLKKFFSLKNILIRQVFPILEQKEVDAVILIDYYGFNIHIAEKAKQNGIPVFYFVSPQVWASRKGRIKKLKKFVTKMLVIFPFEKDLYESHSVPVEFVGHPLMDQIDILEKNSDVSYRSPNGAIHLGLMPGSREKEIVRHLPLMMKSFSQLKSKFKNVSGTLFAVDYLDDEVYSASKQDSSIKITRDNSFSNRLGLSLCLTASGTATLENALLGIPMIVIYQASWLTYWIAKSLIQIPFVSMPNILSGKKIVPELLQTEANPEEISRQAQDYLSNPGKLHAMRTDLIKLKQKLGKPGAYHRAASSILRTQ